MAVGFCGQSRRPNRKEWSCLHVLTSWIFVTVLVLTSCHVHAHSHRSFEKYSHATNIKTKRNPRGPNENKFVYGDWLREAHAPSAAPLVIRAEESKESRRKLQKQGKTKGNYDKTKQKNEGKATALVCRIDSECPVDKYCSTGKCREKKGDGEKCSTHRKCNSNCCFGSSVEKICTAASFCGSNSAENILGGIPQQNPQTTKVVASVPNQKETNESGNVNPSQTKVEASVSNQKQTIAPENSGNIVAQNKQVTTLTPDQKKTTAQIHPTAQQTKVTASAPKQKESTESTHTRPQQTKVADSISNQKQTTSSGGATPQQTKVTASPPNQKQTTVSGYQTPQTKKGPVSAHKEKQLNASSNKTPQKITGSASVKVTTTPPSLKPPVAADNKAPATPPTKTSTATHATTVLTITKSTTKNKEQEKESKFSTTAINTVSPTTTVGTTIRGNSMSTNVIQKTENRTHKNTEQNKDFEGDREEVISPNESKANETSAPTLDNPAELLVALLPSFRIELTFDGEQDHDVAVYVNELGRLSSEFLKESLQRFYTRNFAQLSLSVLGDTSSGRSLAEKQFILKTNFYGIVYFTESLPARNDLQSKLREIFTGRRFLQFLRRTPRGTFSSLSATRAIFDVQSEKGVQNNPSADIDSPTDRKGVSAVASVSAVFVAILCVAAFAAFRRYRSGKTKLTNNTTFTESISSPTSKESTVDPNAFPKVFLDQTHLDEAVIKPFPSRSNVNDTLPKKFEDRSDVNGSELCVIAGGEGAECFRPETPNNDRRNESVRDEDPIPPGTDTSDFISKYSSSSLTDDRSREADAFWNDIETGTSDGGSEEADSFWKENERQTYTLLSVCFESPGSIGARVKKTAEGGCVVDYILPGGQAELVGLKKGDTIYLSNPSGSDSEYDQFLALVKSQNRPIRVQVSRATSGDHTENLHVVDNTSQEERKTDTDGVEGYEAALVMDERTEDDSIDSTAKSRNGVNDLSDEDTETDVNEVEGDETVLSLDEKAEDRSTDSISSDRERRSIMCSESAKDSIDGQQIEPIAEIDELFSLKEVAISTDSSSERSRDAESKSETDDGDEKVSLGKAIMEVEIAEQMSEHGQVTTSRADEKNFKRKNNPSLQTSGSGDVSFAYLSSEDSLPWDENDDNNDLATGAETVVVEVAQNEEQSRRDSCTAKYPPEEVSASDHSSLDNSCNDELEYLMEEGEKEDRVQLQANEVCSRNATEEENVGKQSFDPEDDAVVDQAAETSSLEVDACDESPSEDVFQDELTLRTGVKGKSEKEDRVQLQGNEVCSRNAAEEKDEGKQSFVPGEDAVVGQAAEISSLEVDSFDESPSEDVFQAELTLTTGVKSKSTAGPIPVEPMKTEEKAEPNEHLESGMEERDKKTLPLQTERSPGTGSEKYLIGQQLHENNPSNQKNSQAREEKTAKQQAHSHQGEEETESTATMSEGSADDETTEQEKEVREVQPVGSPQADATASNIESNKKSRQSELEALRGKGLAKAFNWERWPASR